jgi:hypothetical protein
LKNYPTKWQSPCQIWRVKQQNQSFLANGTDWAVSSPYLLWLLSSLPVHLALGSTTPIGRPSASFKNSCILPFRLTMPAASLSVLSKTQLQKAFSVHAGALTHTTSIGICHNAGATKSLLHSPTLKSFAVIKKSLNSEKLYVQLIRETLRDDIRIGIVDTKNIDPDAWKDMVGILVNISSVNLSLFLAFPLLANVDSGRCWLVVRNRITPPENGNLLEELSS